MDTKAPGDRHPVTGQRGAASRTTQPPTTADAGRFAVQAEGLSCSYGSFEAVRDVDLHVHPGELLAVLGTNGAGKTTLLDTLHGQHQPAAGTVRVLGLDPSRQRRRLAARIGVMLQDTALPGELTPQEVLTLWQRLANAGRDHHPVGASLARVGLADRRHTRIGRLSGGERRRLSLAVTLSADPELVFLDEPTAGLDPGFRSDTWELIRNLQRQGTTVVLTTHYLDEAEALADRLAILHHGQVAIEGTLREVLATRQARIDCQLAGGALPPRDQLTGQASLTPSGSTQHLQIRTPDPQADLQVLLEWSQTTGTALDSLSTSPGSLADIFQALRTDPTDPHLHKTLPQEPTR